MNFSLSYLLYRAIFRFGAFWRHWYRDGWVYAVSRLRSTLYSLDQTFAVRVTWRHLWEPLWGDYTIVGRIIGPVLRIARITFGSVLYLLIFLVWLPLVILWFALPVAVLATALLRWMS